MSPSPLTPGPERRPPVNRLAARRLGIDTLDEAVVFMHRDCPVCRSEGFASQSRVELSLNGDGEPILATLSVVTSELVGAGEAGLSEAAWRRLGAAEGDQVSISHPDPVASLTHLRSKMSGERLSPPAMTAIVQDVVAGRYSDIHLAAFVAACAGGGLDFDEVVSLTRAMIDVGRRIDWPRNGGSRDLVVDKHCVGGLLGNRTTPIVVAIVAAHGLTIPKTSSRAITSPAGTADVVATLTEVDLDLPTLRRVVEREGGCLAWGGKVQLSPADDILIRVERALDVDSAGQLVASVLSKKAAAGSTHVVIDIPQGPHAKIKRLEEAARLGRLLQGVGRMVGLEVQFVVTDGTHPVGRGFGPALEARDVLAVLQNDPEAPIDLRERALVLAGRVLEFDPALKEGHGLPLARGLLKDGRAWAKFQAICAAQGGLREPPRARLTHTVHAGQEGKVALIDNWRLGRIAKFAGAPTDPAAGLELHVKVGDAVQPRAPLFTVHAESAGALDYALAYAHREQDVIRLEVQR